CAEPAPIRSPTTTSPVAMPIRTCRGSAACSSPTASTKVRPTRTACSASSSCACEVAEIDQHPVTHVLRDEPVEATYGLRDAVLIRRNQLAQTLRIHARGQRRRADQVGEHHRDLTALGAFARPRHEAEKGLCYRLGAPRQLGDGRKHYPPMSDED